MTFKWYFVDFAIGNICRIFLVFFIRVEEPKRLSGRSSRGPKPE